MEPREHMTFPYLVAQITPPYFFILASRDFDIASFSIMALVMPMVFTGWKVALGISWSTLVAAEMLASNEGLGYMILIGRQFMKTDLIICGMVVIGLIGIVLYALLNKLESVVLRWRRS